MLREKVKRVHFVGIGGIGMSGIAQILLEMGYEVSGSDIRENKNTTTLKSKGAKIYIGHSPENISEEVQVVVFSSAVREDNPEIMRASQLSIPIIPRGEMLAELFKLKEGVAVSGSHGKTTTTSMVAHILEEAGFDPTVIIGGILHRLGGNAKLGSGDLLVSEADESDGSFLKLSPVVSVVTNIDREHLDFYRDTEEIVSSFSRFISSVPFYGFSVVNGDDPLVRRAIRGTNKRVVSFGLSKGNDVMADELKVEEGSYTFAVLLQGKKLGNVRLHIPGRHNVYNALASITVALELGVDFRSIKNSLESFRNAERRMELKGYYQDVVPIYDDYGHHPTEIEAVITALREMYPERRLLMVFQPHRYSRTHFLFEEFVRVLQLPDRVFLLDIFPASEENIYGVSSERLARECGALMVSKEELFERITAELSDKDLLLFMGAGDITSLCDSFLERFSSPLSEHLEHKSHQ